jgi:hypothetical protein
MVAMAEELESSPEDDSIRQPMGSEKPPAAAAALPAPADPPTETSAGPAGNGRRASIQFVLSVMGLVALTVIAVALVVIAVDQTRQTRFMRGSDCMARANDYRPDTFKFPPTYLADAAKACGLKNPYIGP